jgi:signal transduction histidine kinase
MSIRLRLTLMYSLILALTLILFSSVLYVAQSRYTLRIVRNDLATAAHQLTRAWERVRPEMRGGMPGPGIRRPGGGESGPRLQALQMLLGTRPTRDIVRILNPDGTPLDIPLNAESAALPINAAGLAQLRRGRPWIQIVPTDEGRMLVHHQPLQEPIDGRRETIAIVQVARPLTDRDRALRSLGLALISGSVLTTLVAFGAGWGLAGITLRPIQRITQTAREIGEARDFSSRVPHPGPNDELGRLATTFNAMLTRLEDAYQHVAHALQVQRDFVADVSHELRTPLTTIRGNLALLQRTPPLPEAERQDVLDDLIGESERLSRLVRDLLTLARADAGRKLALDAVDLPPLITEVCRQARLLAGDRELTCEPGEGLVARANEDALKQVLLILLDNAIKHSDGPIHVGATASTSHVIIEVRDQGPGISPELQQRIFDRFYRGDTSRSTPGFGLGLSIAYALVKAQKGHLEVESEVGVGSTFMVNFAIESI